MIAIGEAELICDLAETYNIYDYRSLPIRTVGILSYGLGEDSRIKTKLRGGEIISTKQLLALACDRISILIRCMTGAGEDSFKSVQEIMFPAEQQADDAIVFDSVEDFESARMRILESRKEKLWQME